MYSKTYKSTIILIFVLIQFCNNTLIFTSHHPFIFIFLYEYYFISFLKDYNRYRVDIFNVH